MRRAYSFAHGRTVPAEQIDYRHCRDDRVECEICRDRVFKSVRRHSGRETHFLSHHRAAAGHARECEARVARRMRDEAAAGDGGIDRGQSLNIRLGALRRILDRQFASRAIMASKLQRRGNVWIPDPEYPNGHPTLCGLGFLHLIAATGFCIAAAHDGHDHELENGPDTEGGLALRAMLEEERRRRPFGTHSAKQRRWAHDMTALLVRDDSRRPLLALVHHAVADVLSRSADEIALDEVQLMQVLRIMSATPHPELSIHDAPLDPDDPDSPSLGRRADAMVIHRMQGILLEIDYDAKVPAAPPPKPKRKPRPKRTHRRR